MRSLLSSRSIGNMVQVLHARTYAIISIDIASLGRKVLVVNICSTLCFMALVKCKSRWVDDSVSRASRR